MFKLSGRLESELSCPILKILKSQSKLYVELHGDLHLSIKPKTKVAIVTCMDSRLHVAPALGLAPGRCLFYGNAGGRVTEDMIRSLVISPTTNGDKRNCGSSSYRLRGSNLQ